MICCLSFGSSQLYRLVPADGGCEYQSVSSDPMLSLSSLLFLLLLLVFTYRPIELHNLHSRDVQIGIQGQVQCVTWTLDVVAHFLVVLLDEGLDALPLLCHAWHEYEACVLGCRC